MPDEVSIAGRRSWNRFFPALRLVGAIRQAFDLRKLAIAALGLRSSNRVGRYWIASFRSRETPLPMCSNHRRQQTACPKRTFGHR